MNKIQIIGVGYVGLSTLINELSARHTPTEYVLVDIKMEEIEANLRSLLSAYDDTLVPAKTYDFRSDIVEDAYITYICIPTEDLTIPVEILEKIKNGIIVVRSTIGFETGAILENYKSFYIPEFYTEKSIDKIKMYSRDGYLGYDLTLIGRSSKTTPEDLDTILGVHYDFNNSVDQRGNLTNIDTAIAVKLTRNTLISASVNAINSANIICNEKSKNVDFSLVSLFCETFKDHYGRNFKYVEPSFGYGGTCLPKDTEYFAPDLNIINNDIMRKRSETVLKYLKSNSFEFGKILLVGAGFKPHYDSRVNSPTLVLYDFLIEKGYDVWLCDNHTKKIDEKFDVAFYMHKQNHMLTPLNDATKHVNVINMVEWQDTTAQDTEEFNTELYLKLLTGNKIKILLDVILSPVNNGHVIDNVRISHGDDYPFTKYHLPSRLNIDSIKIIGGKRTNVSEWFNHLSNHKFYSVPSTSLYTLECVLDTSCIDLTDNPKKAIVDLINTKIIAEVVDTPW